MKANLPFIIALFLTIAALIIYVGNAIAIRRKSSKIKDFVFDFNLGLPGFGMRENLFAISLIAAGTSISTVFLFFLTAGPVYGFWLFCCPIFFALGNWLMYLVYTRTKENGYFEEKQSSFSGGAGLLPYLGQQLTGSPTVGWLLTLLSFVNLFAVLVLELIVGVEVFGYLASNALGVSVSSWGSFIIFACSVCLMLTYVFLGGFRAVVTSDVWQMRAISVAVAITLLSLVIYLFVSQRTQPDYSTLVVSPKKLVLWTFILNIVIGNLLIPLSQEASWQRFRAFGEEIAFNARSGMKKSVLRAMVLWTGLIVLAFLLLLTLSNTSNTAPLTSMSGVLESLRTLKGIWFPMVVFPLMTVAALSAMYSTADTCVSALIYLLGYARLSRPAMKRNPEPQRVPFSYPIAMAFILIVSLSAYAVVRFWLNPTILQLIFSVFSNLIVISPTVIATTLLRPHTGNPYEQKRALLVICSLVLGTLVFWGSAVGGFILGKDYLWLNQVSLFLGLIAAFFPVLPLFKRER